MNRFLEKIRSKYPLPVIVVYLLMGGEFASGQDYQSRIYNAYLLKNMDSWKEVMVEMESNYQITEDKDLLYDIIEVEYGYIAYCISVKRRKEAREVLERAVGYVNLILVNDEKNPRIFSLQGALYGFRVYLEPFRAIKNRNRSIEANQMAIGLGPDEPQAWMEKANIAFYTPAILGGSKKRAVPLYEKAVRLFELTPERTRQNWIYLNCLAGLGIAYEKAGQIRDADVVYRKLLELEPSFSWVRDDLYPQFLENHSMN